MALSDKVHGIGRDLLKEDVLDRAFEALKDEGVYKGKVPKKLEEKVACMQAHTDALLKKSGREATGNCDTCGQTSDIRLPGCPYCGQCDEDLGTELVKPAPEEHRAELVKPVPEEHRAEIVDEKTGLETILDEAVAQIKAVNRGLNAGQWMIGREIGRVEETGAWKGRLNSDGQVAYRTIARWAEAELGYTKRTMTDALRIYRRFGEEEAKELTTTQMRLLVQLAPEFQDEEVRKLKAGKAAGGKAPTKREIEQRVLGRKPSSGGAKPDPNKVTVAVQEAQKTIYLYARKDLGGLKKAHATVEAGEAKQAKSINDEPFGYFDLTNDVRQFFTIVRSPDGTLKLKIEIKRIDPTEE